MQVSLTRTRTQTWSASHTRARGQPHVHAHGHAVSTHGRLLGAEVACEWCHVCGSFPNTRLCLRGRRSGQGPQGLHGVTESSLSCVRLVASRTCLEQYCSVCR